MKEFDKYLKELKGGLNDFMTPEKDKATIDKTASFSSLIDSMESEYDELKTDYINAVKNQKFQNNGSTDNGNDFKSDDEIINEILGL